MIKNCCYISRGLFRLVGERSVGWVVRHAHRTPASATMRLTVPLRPPYSNNLDPSDFHICGSLKDAFRGSSFVDDDGLRHSVRKDSRLFSK
jgi:hypothetical protein